MSKNSIALLFISGTSKKADHIVLHTDVEQNLYSISGKEKDNDPKTETFVKNTDNLIRLGYLVVNHIVEMKNLRVISASISHEAQSNNSEILFVLQH